MELRANSKTILGILKEKHIQMVTTRVELATLA
jgi:hypothetical protein